jgi:hypothetical protein
VSEDNGSLEIETPVGKAKLHAKRTAELITVLLAVFTGIMAWIVFKHDSEARDNTHRVVETVKEANGDLKDAVRVMTEAQVEMIRAQREANCLLSLPQDKREAEFYSPNSLCKRMAR